MRRAPLSRALALVVLVVGLLVTSIATAQMSETERKAAARAAYMEGVALQDGNKPAEALVKFEAAQKLFDAPTHLLHIAECQAQTGKLVEASETYELLIRKQLGPNPPEAFVAAQRAGEQELPALRARIPTLRVSVKPDPSQLPNLQVYVNDVQVPNELLGIARPVNPGPYKLTAVATGWATTAPVQVELRDKDQRSVELRLTQQAHAQPPVVAPIPAPYGAENQPPATNGAGLPEAPAAPKPAPKAGSSDTGLLLGMHGGVFIPNGTVLQTGIVSADTATGLDTARTSFGDVAKTGGGVGLDGIFRVGRTLLLGLTFDYASLGAPSGTRSTDYSASTVYYGALIGLVSNPDKVAFYGDVGLGYRSLALSERDAGVLTEADFGGIEIGLSMGAMIPAGPMRILPKLGVNYGRFTEGELCPANVCRALNIVDAAGHTMIFAGLGLFYHLDLGKKN